MITEDLELIDQVGIDTFLEDTLNVEKNVKCTECEKWPKDIREKLEKLQIVGNNPIRKINNEFYQIEIINLDITIKIQDLAYSLEDRKEFKMHTVELLELKVTR